MNSEKSNLSLARMVFKGLLFFLLGCVGLFFAPWVAGPVLLVSVLGFAGYQVYQLNKEERQEREATAKRYPLAPLEVILQRQAAVSLPKVKEPEES